MSRAVLLIHGFLSDENDFGAIKDKLDDYYQDVLIVKIPGHGDDMGEHDFDVENTFNVVVNAFDSLRENYKHIDVIGYSMGGSLATYLSSIRDFDKLILLAPANKYINFTYPIKLVKTYFNLKSHIKNDEENIYADKMERINVDNKLSIKILKDRLSLVKILPRYYMTFRRIIKRVNMSIQEIKNPCLIIWGEMDQLVPHSSIDYIRKLCTCEKVKVIEFDDICHLMLLSPANADKVITEIIEFIKEEV